MSNILYLLSCLTCMVIRSTTGNSGLGRNGIETGKQQVILLSEEIIETEEYIR